MVASPEIKPIVRQLLQEFIGIEASGTIRYEAIFDDQNGRYQILAIGWRGEQRVLQPVVMLEVKGNTVHIQANRTDRDIDGALLEVGFSSQQIVNDWLPLEAKRVLEQPTQHLRQA
jgi:hypothetical protein